MSRRKFDTLAYALQLVREGVLSIDSEGRIWRHFVLTKLGRKVVPVRRAENPTMKGYLGLTLGIRGTRRTATVVAHKVVWVYLYGPIPNGLQVNHKDLCKTNNRPSNLELLTPSGNVRHSYENGRPRPWHKATKWRGKDRVSAANVARIVALRDGGKTYREVSEMTGVSESHVARLYQKEKGGGK